MATPKKKSPQLPAKRTDKQKQEAVWDTLRRAWVCRRPNSETVQKIMKIFGYEVEA